MKKNIWKIATVSVTLLAVQCAFGGPPPPRHHHKDDGRGVRLATDIVNLVKAVVTPAPAPVVVTTPAPAPVVVTTPPATITYGYYNNVYVPCYNGWYFYNNVWCWGGHGRRPPHPPAWRPPHRHHRPAPPPPPRRPAYRPVPPRPAPARPAPARPAPRRHNSGHGGRR
ncbi:MAG: hypothetical protein IKA79_06690 [Lentisphaeria bacterium]|nr:hypothetical protein [Lentisphaeria bacterium]